MCIHQSKPLSLVIPEDSLEWQDPERCRAVLHVEKVRERHNIIFRLLILSSVRSEVVVVCLGDHFVGVRLPFLESMLSKRLFRSSWPTYNVAGLLSTLVLGYCDLGAARIIRTFLEVEIGHFKVVARQEERFLLAQFFTLLKCGMPPSDQLLCSSFESCNISDELRTLSVLTCFTPSLHFFPIHSADGFETLGVSIAGDMIR